MLVLNSQKKPLKHLADFSGPINYIGTAYAAAGVASDPSMAHLRWCLTESAILPLGSAYVKQNTVSERATSV